METFWCAEVSEEQEELGFGFIPTVPSQTEQRSMSVSLSSRARSRSNCPSRGLVVSASLMCSWSTLGALPNRLGSFSIVVSA